jgi:hypothetical protein
VLFYTKPYGREFWANLYEVMCDKYKVQDIYAHADQGIYLIILLIRSKPIQNVIMYQVAEIFRSLIIWPCIFL